MQDALRAQGEFGPEEISGGRRWHAVRHGLSIMLLLCFR